MEKYRFKSPPASASGIKKGAAWRRLFMVLGKLLGKVGGDHLVQGLHRFLLIGAIRNQLDGGALHDTQGQNAQQALCIHLPLILLHPDGALELVGLLDKERGRFGVQPNLIVNDRLLTIHTTVPSHSSYCVFSIPDLSRSRQ